MEQGQLKPRIDDLQFYLYQRALHPELFRINQVKRIEQRRYTAEIWIVGLSHVVTVQHGKHCLTELITDENEVLPKMGLAASFPFRGERDHAPMLARAAATVGIGGIFFETHPDPERAKSDAQNTLFLKNVSNIVQSIRSIDRLVKNSRRRHS